MGQDGGRDRRVILTRGTLPPSQSAFDAKMIPNRRCRQTLKMGRRFPMLMLLNRVKIDWPT